MDAAARLAAIRDRIRMAAAGSGRNAQDITLIAVSKTFSASEIMPVLQAGQRIFGENRVQEAKGKWPELRDHYPDIELHLIGPLQSNKIRDAIALFDAIHTVDRPKIARAIADEIARTGRKPQLFIQVNIGEEPQKSGVTPKDLPEFLRLCREEFGLAIEGLMCIPPFDEEPDRHFMQLGELAGKAGLTKLSMGMSADYEAAISHGATHVRVGSAIFGSRD